MEHRIVKVYIYRNVCFGRVFRVFLTPYTIVLFYSCLNLYRSEFVSYFPRFRISGIFLCRLQTIKLNVSLMNNMNEKGLDQTPEEYVVFGFSPGVQILSQVMVGLVCLPYNVKFLRA